VAAAALAIRQSADEETDAYDVILVTDNVKDFAPKQMGSLGVRVMTSGKFLDDAYLAEPDTVERAVRQAVRDLKAPPYSLEELLFSLREQRATTMVKALAAKLGVSPKAKARISSKR
jgi:predicted Zn-dependent protease